MEILRRKRGFAIAASFAVVLALLAFSTGCSKPPAWKAVNDKVMEEHGIDYSPRDDVKATGVVSNLEPGIVTNFNSLTEVTIASGAKGRMYWGGGNLVNWMTLEPGAEIPEETLEGERIMIVWKGSVQQLINGSMVEMISVPRTVIHGTNGICPRKDFVYLQKGAKNAVKAGSEGAVIFEAYWPVRLDYLQKAGAQDIPSSVPMGNFPVPPSIDPNKIYDFFDVQFTEIASGANTRLINGRGVQLSFLTMDPGSFFPHHNHPEEQLMVVLRGAIDEIILDGTSMMKGVAYKPDEASKLEDPSVVLLLPAGMVHGGTNQPKGAFALDVFWPPRADYHANMTKKLNAYHAIIDPAEKVKLVVDGAKDGPGLVFTEGPSWLNGKLYVSSMYFSSGWGGDPKKSALVEMDPDGTYRYITSGKMQTNGTMPMANGNLAVCDMFGHRVIEMTTKGRIVRTLASKFNGKSLDGPNDLVIDAKGGIYFTDPQFTPDSEKNQPGRSVYYRKPNGDVIRVIEPDEFAMPNGVILSPDGKTLYVNNTYDNEPSFWNIDSDKDNFLWAYDVNDDATLSNGRKHGVLALTPDVLEREGRSTSADGMTMDEKGHIYVATQIGIQIICPDTGANLGIINFPVMPVSCCFGGDDMQTLYAACYDRIYSIRTKVKGVVYPLK
ncbi:SMP-30/gluconolactonase/LRE family protein [Candidatus Latescibacterota bacterium]